MVAIVQRLDEVIMSKFTFEVTSGNFDEQVMRSALPVLVEFTADWCPPCKMLAPVLDEIAQRYEGVMRIGTLDADDYPELQQQFGVMGLPTMILFKDGQAVEGIVGYNPRPKIEAKLAPYLQPVSG